MLSLRQVPHGPSVILYALLVMALYTNAPLVCIEANQTRTHGHHHRM